MADLLPVVRPQDCDCGVSQNAITAHSEGCLSRAVPIVPMPDRVTYQCPDCPESFSHAEPFEAHGMYLDHLAKHDTDDAEQVAIARRTWEVPD